MMKNSENKGLENLDIQIKPCKTKGAIAATSPKIKKLNLSKIKKKFPKKLILDTPILLVIDYGKSNNGKNGSIDCGEIIIHQHGLLTFKELKDKEKISEIAKEIFKAGFLN